MHPLVVKDALGLQNINKSFIYREQDKWAFLKVSLPLLGYPSLDLID